MIPEELYRLLTHFENSTISFLELDMSGFKIKLKRNDLSCATSSVFPVESKISKGILDSPKIEESMIVEESIGVEVTAPLVGIFYESSTPDAPIFAPVGSVVKKGQILGLIESMKMFNEIVSPIDGTVKQILINNEAVVEFGTPLFIIEEFAHV